MDKCKIKVVPCNDPNAEGAWVELPETYSYPKTRNWSNAADSVAAWVPPGHFVVAISRVFG